MDGHRQKRTSKDRKGREGQERKRTGHVGTFCALNVEETMRCQGGNYMETDRESEAGLA